MKKYWEKTINYWLKKVNTDKINLKSFLIDRLTANNTIYRDSLYLTEFSYFNLSEFSECFYSLNTWWFFNVIRSNSPEVFWGNMQQMYRRTPMPKGDFDKVAKVAKQLHWNHTSAWVFSCKFAAYFQDMFS